MDREWPQFAHGRVPWQSIVSMDTYGPAEHAHPQAFPPSGWPSKFTVDYLNAIILLALAFLALPWLVGRLVRDPASVLEGRGRQVLRSGRPG
jgi:hypothetical protein